MVAAARALLTARFACARMASVGRSVKICVALTQRKKRPEFVVVATQT